MHEPVLLSILLHLDTMTIFNQELHTSHIFYTWVGMAVLFIVAFIVRSKISMVPGQLQNFWESMIQPLEDFAVENLGENAGRVFFPLLGTLFIYILFLNLMGLLPLFDAPTANLNTNVGMALLVFFLYHAVGFRHHGIGYLKHFCGPVKILAPVMFPIEVINHCARPLSLTLRLFGNIKGEELVLLVVMMLAPILGTLPLMFLFIFVKILQAFIFYLLSMVYIQGSLEEAH